MKGGQAMFFDVFGTLVDWRTSVAREAKRILAPLGHQLDWPAFADAWRAEYQPGMEEVRAGRIPFCKLDVLHRRNLERFMPRFGLRDLPDNVLNELTLAWHRLDAWPEECAVVLPLRPVQSIAAVRVTATDGSVATLAPDRYILDGASAPPRLHPKIGPWPETGVRAQGIEIAFTAGFGDEAASVPAPIRQALLMLVAHWHEHREPVLVGSAAQVIPDNVSSLLMPYRTVRL